MKKIVSLGFVATMALTLAGCSDASASLSNPSEVLISVGGENITKEDLYTPLLMNSGYATVYEMAMNTIYDKEVPITDELNEKAQKSMEETKGSLGEDAFKTNVLDRYGYKDDAEFVARASLPSVRLSELTKLFLTENADAQFTTYHPVKVQIAAAASAESAQSILDAIKGETSFADAANEFGKTDTYKGDEIIVTSASGLPSVVFSKIQTVAEPTLIDSVIADETNSTWYVVKVTNTDPNSFKEDAIQAILDKSTSAKQDATIAYLKKYEFNIYDIDIYNGFKENYPTYLVQDAE